MFTIDKSYRPKLIQNLSANDYHADKTAVSSSQLRRILKSPKAFKYGLEAPREETDAMRIGTLVHLAILEPDEYFSRVVVMPEFTGQTKDGRESKNSADAKARRQAWIDEMTAENKIISTEEERAQVLSIQKCVNDHEDVRTLLSAGAAESSLFFAHEHTGVLNKIRPDFINQNYGALVDIKTTQDCSPSSFSRSIWQYRYDFQLAMYGYGLKQCLGDFPQVYAFIAIEKNAPYECAVYAADEQMIRTGLESYHRAMDRLAGCMAADQWESAQQKMQTISLPNYVKGNYDE